MNKIRFSHQGDVPHYCQRCRHHTTNERSSDNRIQFIVTVFEGCAVAHFICEECREQYKRDLEKDVETKNPFE